MRSKQNPYPLVSAVCAVLFYAFAFCYNFFLQSDVLAYAQHVLSGGLTTYRPFIGALVFTLMLACLSYVTANLASRRSHAFPALYHLPSALLLASVTNVRVISSDEELLFGCAWVVGIVVLLAYVLFCRLLRYVLIPPSKSHALTLLRVLCLNIILVLMICGYVVCFGNTSEEDHLRLHAEKSLVDNRYADAAFTGNRQRFATPQLLMLRAYAMAKTNLLGEHFFENCVPASSECLLPGTGNELLLFPAERIYKMLGGVKLKGMPVAEYLRLLDKRGMLKSGGKDYLCIAALLDRDLDKFAEYYLKFYGTEVSPPKHYREALTLYHHLRANPLVDFSIPEMEADYSDFQLLLKRKSPTLRDTYRDTYWYYFFTRSPQGCSLTVRE